MSNPNPPANKNQPDRATVERIVLEESAAACAHRMEVLSMARLPNAIKARRAAFTRILRETGCSVEGLAQVWGCWPGSITAAIGADAAAQPDPDPAYVRVTGLRLTSPDAPSVAAAMASFNHIDGRRS